MRYRNPRTHSLTHSLTDLVTAVKRPTLGLGGLQLLPASTKPTLLAHGDCTAVCSWRADGRISHTASRRRIHPSIINTAPPPPAPAAAAAATAIFIFINQSLGVVVHVLRRARFVAGRRRRTDARNVRRVLPITAPPSEKYHPGYLPPPFVG